MFTSHYYDLMAQYNRWMNRNLYAVCAPIPDAQRKADRGAFFKSIHGTLNHLVWADRVWLARFGVGTLPTARIGEELYADFDTLHSARLHLDEIIAHWTAALDLSQVVNTFEFKSVVDGKTRRAPQWVFIVQMFNHQTHHRGQVTTLLKQLNYDPGVTDIPWMPGAVDFF